MNEEGASLLVPDGPHDVREGLRQGWGRAWGSLVVISDPPSCPPGHTEPQLMLLDANGS